MSSPNTFPDNNKADDLLKRYMKILVYLFELSKSAENSKQPESLAIDNFSAGGIRHLLHSDSKAAFDWLRSECLKFTPEQEPALNQTIEAKKHMLAIVAEVAMAAAGELEAWCEEVGEEQRVLEMAETFESLKGFVKQLDPTGY